MRRVTKNWKPPSAKKSVGVKSLTPLHISMSTTKRKSTTPNPTAPKGELKFIKDCPISRLRPYKKNPRRNEKAVAPVVNSMAQYGFINPIIVDKDFNICAGHTRFEAAKQIGLKHVPVIIATNLTGDLFAGYNIADNKSAELAEWNISGLAKIIQDLNSREFNVDALGGDTDWIKRMLQFQPDHGIDAKSDGGAGTIPKNPTTKKGDLWKIGGHYLLCGDATDKQDMERLCRRVPDLCFTDPPYSVDYDKSYKQKYRKGHAAIEHYSWDGKGGAPHILSFLGLLPCTFLIFTYPVDRHMMILAKALTDAAYVPIKHLVWVKDSFSFWRGAMYQQKHESILLCVRNKKPFPRGRVIPRGATTLLEYPKPHSHDLHPTAKPLEMWEYLLLNHTKPGQTIIDPFAGSGTTAIACGQNDRMSLSMELAPGYCDVIIERMKATLGLSAERVK